MTTKKTKKERRTPPPTMDSIAFKARVNLGQDKEKRGTVKEEPVATPKAKAAPKKDVAKKLLWGQSATAALIVNMIEHKNDQDAFIKSCSKLKSDAKETDKYIYESKVFPADRIIQKAQLVVKQMRSDGYDVHLPKKVRESAVDYEKIYESLTIKPTLKVKKKK